MNPIGLVKTTIPFKPFSGSSEKWQADVALPLSLLPEPMQEKNAFGGKPRRFALSARFNLQGVTGSAKTI
jgi:uncharacterized metal-binding protein YceD (DUF177 family)